MSYQALAWLLSLLGIEVKKKPSEPDMNKLMRELHQLYRVEVVNQCKAYRRFVEDYVTSHLGIPMVATPEGVLAFNQELSMRNKICALLMERKDLIESFLSVPCLSDEDIVSLLAKFDREEHDRSHDLVAVNSCLKEADWEALADALNSLRLLETPITSEDLASLSTTGKSSRSYKVNSTSRGAYIAYFFYWLSYYKLIPKAWKSIICRYQRLLRTSGKPMTADDLGTPLTRMNIHKMHMKPYADIEQAVKKAIKAC